MRKMVLAQPTTVPTTGRVRMGATVNDFIEQVPRDNPQRSDNTELHAHDQGEQWRKDCDNSEGDHRFLPPGDEKICLRVMPAMYLCARPLQGTAVKCKAVHQVFEQRPHGNAHQECGKRKKHSTASIRLESQVAETDYS